jgi:hypothetical protein
LEKVLWEDIGMDIKASLAPNPGPSFIAPYPYGKEKKVKSF